MAVRETTQDIAAPTAPSPSMARFAGEGALRANAFKNSLRATYQTVAQSYRTAHQYHAKELSEVNVQAAQKIKPPSKMRYGLFVVLSGVIDFWISPPITALWVTTFIGGLLATIVLAIFMWLAGWVFLGSHGKRAAKHRKELQQQSKNLQRDIQVVQQEYRKFQQWLSAAANRFPAIAARTTSAAARVGRAVKKYKIVKKVGQAVNWLTRIFSNGVVKQGSEAIPVWNILPWWTIGAAAAYFTHRGDWREAQDLLAQYNQGKASVLDMTDTMYQTRLAVISDAAETTPFYA